MVGRNEKLLQSEFQEILLFQLMMADDMLAVAETLRRHFPARQYISCIQSQ
jgi:hypothetical protein